MITKFRAILELVGGGISGPDDGPISKYNFHDDQTPPTEEEIQTKLHELQLKEPMKILREIRNQKLFETDWWCVSDRVPTAEQLKYRQELRDITSIATPYFDKDGNFYVDTQFTWPEKPE